MISLAFDFTSNRRSIAVATSTQLLAEVVHAETRETPAFALIDTVLTEASVDRSQIQRLIIAIGPGSYTGIRIAISLAQGWHLATGVEVIPIDTFEALRLAATREARFPAPWTFAIDAQRHEFATRTWTGSYWEAPVKLIEAARLVEMLANGQVLLGPELGRWFRGLGDSHTGGASAEMCELYSSARDTFNAAVGINPVSPELLTPIYLRKSEFVKSIPSRDLSGITL